MRQNKRVDCKEIQGEGAYMLIKPLAFYERQAKLSITELGQRVVEWNWTDWEDNPLPLPHTDEARTMLTDPESEFILNQFGYYTIRETLTGNSQTPKADNGPN